MSIAREDLAGVVRELRANPDLCAELRALLWAAPVEVKPVIVFERINDFAQRAGVSRRTIFKLISEGLPVVGDGKRRRVDIEKGIEWMRKRSGVVDIEMARSARASAAKAAKRK